jgi:nucleotide-binding universal stress UspA family protein
MFLTILVGTDGSETANRAVARAAELASQTGDVLHIVTAYQPPSVQKLEAQRASIPEEFRWRLSADSDAVATLHAAAAQALQAGVRAETRADQGDPAKVILNAAQDLGAQLIVVGCKGIERRILGSVPQTVAQDATCDVLLVHTT